ncbi:unnamed protein product [Amoebophrya sp. A25]|nr:unnamed protein product [Amoebophrya sp. A25]|eukprot:GSA25T00009026001.1
MGQETTKILRLSRNRTYGASSSMDERLDRMCSMLFASREDWNSIAKGWIKEHLRVTFGH